MQLACQTSPFELLASDDAAQRIPGDSPGKIDRDRRPVGKLLGEPQVRAVEALVSTELVVRYEHADRHIAQHQWNVEPRPRAEQSNGVLVYLWILEQRVDALAMATLEDTAGLG